MGRCGCRGEIEVRIRERLVGGQAFFVFCVEQVLYRMKNARFTRSWIKTGKIICQIQSLNYVFLNENQQIKHIIKIKKFIVLSI